MAAELNTTKFEKFISDYPIYEYRLLDAKALSVAERVRIVCQQECERNDLGLSTGGWNP